MCNVYTTNFIAGRLMTNTIRMPNQIVCCIVKCGTINKELTIKYFNLHGREEEEDSVWEHRVIYQ